MSNTSAFNVWRSFHRGFLCKILRYFCFAFSNFQANLNRSEHQEAAQHTGVGIIENLEMEVIQVIIWISIES